MYATAWLVSLPSNISKQLAARANKGDWMKSFTYSKGNVTLEIISYNLLDNSIHVYSQLHREKSYITDYKMYVNVVFSL